MNVRAPLLYAEIQNQLRYEANNDNYDQQFKQIFDMTVAKVIPAFEKLNSDVSVHHPILRLSSAFHVFRTCRLFNLRFVKDQELISIVGEFVHLTKLPFVNDMQIDLGVDVDGYYKAATEADDELDS